LIHQTCFRCKRHFELDPVFVGFELSKLKTDKPAYYQAICPACRVVNKISVTQMQAELDAVSAEVEKMVAEHEENAAKAKAEARARAEAKKAEAGEK
jgi:phage FluMu protein Com